MKVKGTLAIIMQAIRGEVVVTAEIMDAINAVYDARVPKSWLYSPAGDEISWLAPSLGVWYGGLISRDAQYRTWLANGRPHTYWMGGFFNPQGFLTAVQQEITRSRKNESWALDSVMLHAEVTDYLQEQIKSSSKVRRSTSLFRMCVCNSLCVSNGATGRSLCSRIVSGRRRLESKRRFSH